MQLLGTGFQRSAKNCRIVTNTATLAHAKWNAEGAGEDLDTVNFESIGIDEGVLGIESAKVAFGGDWDASQNPIDYNGSAPPGLYPRDDLPDTYFYTNVTDNLYWFFPYLRIRSATNGGEVRGKVTFDCSGMSQGNWDFPTGSV